MRLTTDEEHLLGSDEIMTVVTQRRHKAHNKHFEP